MSSPAGAVDWVVCRIFKRAKPGRGREDDAEEAPSSPSSASSCVTDNSSDHEEDDGEQSSGVASNYGA